MRPAKTGPLRRYSCSFRRSTSTSRMKFCWLFGSTKDPWIKASNGPPMVPNLLAHPQLPSTDLLLLLQSFPARVLQAHDLLIMLLHGTNLEPFEKKKRFLHPAQVGSKIQMPKKWSTFYCTKILKSMSVETPKNHWDPLKVRAKGPSSAVSSRTTSKRC